MIDLSNLDHGKGNDAELLPHGGPNPGGDYNLLPYPSLAYEFTQPARLAALAMLAGLSAPSVERARVLEIGCASGGNIIPLAARFPEARFLGVDLSTRHIEDGARRIAALGLKNVELRQADVTTLDLSAQQFDYIICHGVFSWVPQAAQEAILRLCGETLAPDGMAIVSYNVLPGWHLRSVIRDICMHHAGREGSPQLRVSRARQALENIADLAGSSEPFAQLLKNEARRLAQRPAAYILGEFLVETNAPLHFRDFTKRAGRYGLGYLCEADLLASTPRVASPEVADRIRAMAGGGRMDFEQNVDFFTGRTFRRSILVKSARAGAARNTEPQRFRGLHFAAELHADTSRSTPQVAVFMDARGRAVRAEDAAVRHALSCLGQRYPDTLTLGDLVERDTEAESRVCKALFLLTGTGQVNAYALPLVVGQADSPCPNVWSFARAEAAGGQRWISTLRHSSVPLNPVMTALLPKMDGANDRAALAEFLMEVLRRKAVSVPELSIDTAPWADARLREVACEYVDAAVALLSRQAVLERQHP